MQIYSSNYKNYSYQRDRRQPLKRSRSKVSLFLRPVILIFALLIGTTFIKNQLFNQPSSSVAPTVLASTTENEPPPPPPKKVTDTSQLQATLDQITRKYSYNTSVAVVDLNSGNEIQTGDSYPYVAASTTKLLSAIYYLDEVEAGRESLDKKIAGKAASEQLRLMINRSDNTAWRDINKYLETSRIQAFANSHGAASYDPVKNTITSKDMALLLAKFYKLEMLNRENTDLLLSWMQNTSEERFIPAAIPDGQKIYHKAGYLNDRVHDVAIVDNGVSPFIIVIYSKTYSGNYDYSEGQRLFRQVTAEVVRVFNK